MSGRRTRAGTGTPTRVGTTKRGETKWAYAIKSFVGFLEGTGKSANTIQSYRSDLATFEEFLKKASGKEEVHLGALDAAGIEAYRAHLRKAGYRTNTRRRKILTAHRFLKYLAGRDRVGEVVARKIPAPHKVERVPRVVSQAELLQKIRELPVEGVLERRNRALLWLLAETGLQVSEVGLLRGADVSVAGVGPRIEIPGKSARALPVSPELARALLDSFGTRDPREKIFQGFNKYGPLTGAITARAVELLVKTYGPRLGFKSVTPRTFRQSAVVAWNAAGVERDEIRRRLGLKTDYAFRSFEPLFRAHEKRA